MPYIYFTCIYIRSIYIMFIYKALTYITFIYKGLYITYGTFYIKNVPHIYNINFI